MILVIQCPYAERSRESFVKAGATMASALSDRITTGALDCYMDGSDPL